MKVDAYQCQFKETITFVSVPFRSHECLIGIRITDPNCYLNEI